jgi:hypothetical protein
MSGPFAKSLIGFGDFRCGVMRMRGFTQTDVAGGASGAFAEHHFNFVGLWQHQKNAGDKIASGT